MRRLGSIDCNPELFFSGIFGRWYPGPHPSSFLTVLHQENKAMGRERHGVGGPAAASMCQIQFRVGREGGLERG